MDTSLDQKITARSKEFFASISGESPSIFNKGWWSGKVMDWAMKNDHFKVQLFRFVDVLPYLTTTESLSRHIEDYFGGEGQDIPTFMRWGAKGAGLSSLFIGRVVNKTIRTNIEGMAKQFIIGETTDDAIQTLTDMRTKDFAFTVDILGEATVSEEEAQAYLEKYLELLDQLKVHFLDSLGITDSSLDWEHAPLINLSVKPSALFSQTHPMDFEGSVAGILGRLEPIFRRVVELEGSLCIDMEHYQLKEITLEVFRRLRSCKEFRHYPYLGLAIQSYLRDTDQDLDNLLQWAKVEALPISIRLVKGAYWDYETIIAKQNGWPIPVYTIKAESDAAFERHTLMILENHDICHYACGSHNIRSISAAMQMAEELQVPENKFEFQVLYGMAEPVRKGLLNIARRVRLYSPYGDLLPGMAYLVRRLLENTANESFLRQSFVEETKLARLMENPLTTLAREKETAKKRDSKPNRDHFSNEPMADFSKADIRHGFKEGLQKVRQELGRTYPLHIDGRDITTTDLLSSLNPAHPEEIIGHICQASTKEIDMALAAARKVLPAWNEKTPGERAKYLFKAADIIRKRSDDLCAWQILEVGKQWNQAQADIAEAIDFLEYYGREMIRLGTPRRMGNTPGEVNHLVYQPKGIAAVIAPWNFPLAIGCGMSAAALVTGNPVLFKPAGPAAVVGHTLLEIFKEAGIPPGVFNYIPGRSSHIGDYLVEHPEISLIAFTGSMEVGHRIIKKASVVQPGQVQIKRTIVELGGKNGIIIDDDADLDEAVKQVLNSAFGFQGQKCSACSRVIVVEPIYEKFIQRLIQAASSISIGPAEDPAFFLGPVIDEAAQNKILTYLELAKVEGNILFESKVPETGYYVPLTIVDEITPQHRIAQEEVFGPLLTVMRVKDIQQAIEWANDTIFGLTGAIFSRSPHHLDLAREKFNVGNLYLNRGSTGALVERHPFGGLKMSGVGSKAGGPDYLLQFMDSRSISENTMRRGFAPTQESKGSKFYP